MLDSLRFRLRRLFSSSKVGLLSIGMGESYAQPCAGADVGARRLCEAITPRCDYSKLLVNSSATKANVMAEMRKVCGYDLAIITYNGHGGRRRGSQNEADGYDEMIYLYDQPMLDNEVWGIVSKAKGRVFMVFDCCYAETMFCGDWHRMHDTFRIAGLPRDAVDLMCWSACGEGQLSYGMEPLGGLFTASLVRHAKAGYTYDEAWKRVSGDSEVATREVAHLTVLKTNSKFRGKKLFS